ncbi:tRNA (adenosine(37)-N6)-threonylcarbamoyltransferase complex ATPase subunit type 1 TsaE [Treponema zuelzerae]|uniref:tRNA threonylcarbamoyladenosine biosynthesis protein TsaE n=1 Tax=Teretinema zuelzerae TaxID=156 RepID=A0AAE3EI49_9SPIR|nr:tRNA (adenosine(37)-N6)-threonylcarbamoyltransferase complex ATPase subunit type 1 TsaE [Teretinema zuelzerae]MCD1654877.1 tRNA (adenosine(37)-N6)-threonylcarbamoyltransferase complex ATPase subunit type 1 TsaE [Teretinema zuelzerae]
MILESHSREETLKIGFEIGKRLQKGDVIALQGTLAAGKTTLTQGIALGMGIDEQITSPTFTLISEYPNRIPLYHMDAYRLDSVQDFLDLGVEELLWGDGACVVEWSEKVMEAMPKNAIVIRLSVDQSGVHRIESENWPWGDAF